MTSQSGLFGATRPRRSFTRRDRMIFIFKHRYAIFLTFIVVVALAAAGLRSLPPSYVTTAKVLIRVDQQAVPSFFSGITATRQSDSYDNSGRTLENEMQLMRALPLSEEVVKQLGLTYDRVYHPPYVHLLDPLSDLYDRLAQKYFGVAPDPNKRGEVATALALRSALTVKIAESSSAESSADVIEVSLRGIDPDVTKESLSRLLDLYTVHDQNMNEAIGQHAYDILNRQVETARQNLAAAQAMIETFVASKGLNQQVIAPDASQQSPGARADTKLLTLPGNASPVEILKARLTDMEIGLVRLQQTSPGRTEQIRSLKASIAELKGRLDREQRQMASNDVAMMGLERNLRHADAVYTELQKRMTEVGLFIDMNASQMNSRVIIEPPLRPRQSDWQRSALLTLGAALSGLVLGIGFAGLREAADHRLQSEDDVREHLGAPVIATLPQTRKARKLMRARRASMKRRPAHV
jgi:uncharacterized protein involved in exopolysaccharide biosynthesis